MQPIVEQQRPLAEYMALPASQYSVLDGRKVERLGEDTFRCYVGELRMFSFSVEPVLTLSVKVEPGGCTIQLLSCQLKGSKMVEQVNDKFTAQMSNVVRFRPAQAQQHHEGKQKADKEITSETELMVSLEIPEWCGFLPTSSVESVGNSVLQGVINAMVPQFLSQLRKDYELWAGGDTSRKPVGDL